jgi:ATP-binding cassette subfamily C protein
MIAHRLSTIREADQIYYLDLGKIEAKGSFDSLKATHKNFADQAHLMGL